MISYDLREQHDHFGNAPHLLAPEDAAALDAGQVQRTGGDNRCPCGKLYYDHPPVLGALWATRLCNGSLVKL